MSDNKEGLSPEQEAQAVLATVLSTANGIFIGSAITLLHVGKSEELERSVTNYLTNYLQQLLSEGIVEDDIAYLLAQADATAQQTKDNIYEIAHYLLGICVENLLEIKLKAADSAPVLS